MRNRISKIAIAASVAIATTALAAPVASGDPEGQVADLEVLASAEPSSFDYLTGDQVVVAIDAVNRGNWPAPMAELTISVPVGFVSDGFTATDGTFDPGNGVWLIDNVEKRSTETLELAGTLAEPGRHELTVTRTGGHFIDPEAANDSASLTFSVSSPPEPSEPPIAGPAPAPKPNVSSRNDDPEPAEAPPAPANAPADLPEEGKTINAQGTQGTVLVKEKGQKPRPIDPGGELLAPGTVLDTRDGKVALTSEYNGKLDEMAFWGGKFRMGQRESAKPFANVKLVGAKDCSQEARRGRAKDREVRVAGKRKARGKKRGKGRKLWAKSKKGRKAHYRTNGRMGSATVRGTKWLTIDRCDGSTMFKLRRGKLAINDFSKPGKVDKVLRDRGTYVAKPR